MRQQEIRPRSRMVSRDCGRCASQYIRCEKLVTLESGWQYCDDTGEELRRLGNCVYLGKICQAEHDSSKRHPPKAWIAHKTRIKAVPVPKVAHPRKPKASRRQQIVTCETLGNATHCKDYKQRCEHLMGKYKLWCEWLGCKSDLLSRDKYGPIRPQECQDEPADAKEEK